MEPRILPLTDTLAPAAARAILDQTKQAIGMVPNLHRTLAHSPAALRAYFETAKALGAGVLSPRLREHLAVAVAGQNGCAYCASAHTAIGKSVGIDAGELTCNLTGASGDVKVAAALDFAGALLETRGDVSDDQLAALRAAGYSDAEVVELVAHVGMNFFTNIFNRLARTSIDFPVVELSAAAR